MKFDEGVWDGREDIDVVNAIEVYSYSTHLDDSSTSIKNETNAEPHIKAICSTKHIRHRGDLLNKPTITLKITSPGPGIIGIETSHFHAKSQYREPTNDHYPSGRPAESAASVDATEDHANLVTAGGLASASVDLRPHSLRVDIRDAHGKVVTNLGQSSISWILNKAASPLMAIKENASQTINDPFYRSPSSFRQSYSSLALALTPGEKVYGLGERFGPFVKNGQVVESSNDDGGTSTDAAYKSIPFYLTNKNYGVLVDQLDHVSYEVQSDKMTKVQMSVPGERLKIYIIVGESPKDVLTRYTDFTGRAPLPPDWSYGLWLSTSFLTSYDEGTVTSYLDRMRDIDIPVHVFHFDCFWMRAHAWCDFEFDPKYFPDPHGFLDRLHKRGIKVCVWINPWVGQASRLFVEGDREGYFVQRTDGRTFQSDIWQSGCATVDFTNPAAKRWWQKYLSDLLDVGVDCFKTDFGERIVTEGVKYHDGSNPRAMHNAYTRLYNEAVYEVLVAKKGAAEACLFARSATTGTQRFPVHWGGDTDSTFDGLAETIRGGLSLGLSGFGYHSSDIGGFKAEGKGGNDATAPPPGTIYKRWCQFGLLSSHSRLHGSGSPRVPWVVDEEACDVLRKFTKLKNRMEPYLTSQSIQGVVEQGHPIMRPMLLEYPDDKTCWFLDQQYMLGTDLLVAPVFGESDVDYYVPAGVFTNILNGAEVAGPAWISESHSMTSLPVLLRPDAALIIGKPGHTVLDRIDSRGFTVVVSRQISQPLKVVVRLRDDTTLLVDIAPICESDKLVGVEVSQSASGVPCDVLVVGAGIGMDHENVLSASFEGDQPCRVKW